MGYIIALWCGGACKNNGGYNPSKPVVGGAGVYYPRGSSTKRARKHQYKPFAANINQGNITATNNSKPNYLSDSSDYRSIMLIVRNSLIARC